MKNITLVLILGAVSFVSGWTIRDRQDMQHEASVAHAEADAQVAAGLLPEGHPRVLPPGHPPILPEGHPMISEHSGTCPGTRPRSSAPAADEAYSTTPPDGLIST